MDKWTEGELKEKTEKNEDVDRFDALDKMDHLIRKLLQGNLSLPMTYWVYGVLAGFVWAVVFVSLKNFFDFEASSEAAKLFYFLMIAYFVVVYMGIWNSAGKYTGPKVWQIMAKFIVVITAIPIILGTLKLLII